MSSIGTGVAAGVASVAHNAQQSAKARDAARSAAERLRREAADTFVQRLQSAGQADDPDAELPDRQAPGYEQLYLRDIDGQPLGDPSREVADTPYANLPVPPPPPGHPLYEHLDVVA
ncbi:MAG: hypothetical protein AAF800_11665 [Planctomycetota bacterium]